MALRFCDSFSHYNSSTTQNGKWSAWSGSVNTTLGRRGGYCGQNVAATRVLDNQGTWIIGAAFNQGQNLINSNPLLQLIDSGTTQVDVRPGNAGTLLITRNGTTIATSAAGVYTANTYFYLELKAVIAPGTGGSAYCRVNGTVVCSVTGTNTSSTGTSTANTVGIGVGNASGSTTYVCDFTACDGTGAVNNDYLGDVAVKCLLPTSDGNYTQWTPNSGTPHWSRVSEAAPDDDTTYNSTTTVNNIDSYKVTTLAAGTVFGVQINLRTRIDDAGPHTIAPFIRQASTDYPGTAQSESSTYADVRQIYEQDPNTSAAWTVTGVNAAEYGAKMIS